MLVSGAKAIIDITTKAQKAVIEKLEVKLNICGARSIGETLKRLTDNIIGEVDYMSPFKDFVPYLCRLTLTCRSTRSLVGPNCERLSLFRETFYKRRWRLHGHNLTRL